MIARRAYAPGFQMEGNLRMAACSIVIAVLLVCGADAQNAGTPSRPARAPQYISLRFETSVPKPAEEVWRRVGRFCAEWLPRPCRVTSGKDGEIGAVREFGQVREVVVGLTSLSYTF